MPLGGSIPLPTADTARSPSRKAAVRKTAMRRCDSGPCLQPRGVTQRGTLLRSKSGFDSRRGFRFRGRGETGSRDARIVQFRGRHPAAPPLESYPQTWYAPSRLTDYSRGYPPAVCPRGEIGHHGSFLRSSSGFESRRGRGASRSRPRDRRDEVLDRRSSRSGFESRRGRRL